MTPPRLNRQSPYSHKLLANAAERLRADLIDPVLNAEDVSPGEKLESLRAVLQRLTARCYAIHITTEDRDEAYQLFTVLNDRGRSLSDGDLLRTRTLELLEGHATMQQPAEGNWDQVLKSSPAQVRGFLRSYYASHRGRRWPSKDLHKVFWSAFFLFTAPLDAEHAEAVVGRIQALAEEHATYLKIQAGEWPYEDATSSAWHIQRLSRLVKILRQQASVPLLLSIARTRDESFFSQVVTFLERFTFRYNISGGHASQLGDRYYSESKKVRNAPDAYTLEALEEALIAQLARYSPESIFRSNLAQRMNYQVSPTPLIKHFLTTLDDYAPWLDAGAEGTPTPDTITAYDLQALEVEHIYPQHPRQHIEELDPHIHALGNLTFWAPGDNRSANNAPLPEKQPRYRDSRVRMTRAVGELDSWDSRQLLARQEDLIRRALNVFRFRIPSAVEVREESAAQAWFVQQNPGSRYRDREGRLSRSP